jgi:hypothetical protein
LTTAVRLLVHGAIVVSGFVWSGDGDEWREKGFRATFVAAWEDAWALQPDYAPRLLKRSAVTPKTAMPRADPIDAAIFDGNIDEHAIRNAQST